MLIRKSFGRILKEFKWETAEGELIVAYTKAQKILHWVLAVLVLFWLFVGGELIEEAEGADKVMAFAFHSGGALLIFVLFMIRLKLRLKNPAQPMLELKPWEKTWSMRVHLAFYVLLAVMVFSGIMQGIFFEQEVRLAGLVPITVSFQENLFGVFHGIHGVTASILKALILLHILAALKHQFIDRQPFIQRMW